MLSSPEKKKLYDQLIADHHAGKKKFNNVAQFHAAYLEAGGSPRRKSVGNDRFYRGVKVGRALKRRGKKALSKMGEALKAASRNPRTPTPPRSSRAPARTTATGCKGRPPRRPCSCIRTSTRSATTSSTHRLRDSLEAAGIM